MNAIKRVAVLMFITAIHCINLSSVTGQIIKGKVVNDQGNPLSGANVLWVHTTQGIATDKKGEFTLSADNISDRRLVVSFVGYKTDTIPVQALDHLTVKLSETKILDEITITDKQPDTYISMMDPIKIEIMTGKELIKGACCDLAGCFNTSASVQPTVTNIVTNAQELRILGLSGVYNQVLIDGLPLIQGLSYTYGMSSYPGPFIDNIYISKGANSVLQGYESISGQINVLLKDPQKSETLFLNAYMNSFAEKQFNTYYSEKTGKWSKLAAAHVALPGSVFDRDDDSFLDLPLLARYLILNKIQYSDEDSTGLSTRIGLRFLAENRRGGQIRFIEETDTGSIQAYGQEVEFEQPEIYTKTGYRFDDDNAIAVLSSLYNHEQKSLFGETKYTGSQVNFYSNLQYELKWREKHFLKSGISMRISSLDEMIRLDRNPLNKTFAKRYLKEEYIPGIFAENTFRWFDDDVTFITGFRADYHNEFGMATTPRMLCKYDFNDNTNFRFSAGKGWRTVNLFSENVNLLASQRDIIFTELLKPEEAVNYGMNFMHRFEKSWYEGAASVDFYRTEFQNQVFPDYDTDVTKAYIGNCSGISVSNGFQAEINLVFYESLSLKTAYNYLDVYRTQNGKKVQLPFNSTHKFLSAFSYKTFNEQWQFDANVHWYGEQRLPDSETSPEEFRQPEKSKPYTIVNSQITRIMNDFEFYFGCENIFDFRQKRPIISWQNPFGPYFDTSFVWGPTRGREFYIGVRYKMN